MSQRPPNVPESLVAVVLTHNEEANLPACLASLAACTDRVVVVDSGSTDTTVDIARRHGAEVLEHPFKTHSRQWQWAIDNLVTAGACDTRAWVLGLDADQRITPELAREIRGVLASPERDLADGFYVKRRQVFRGRWIRHGGYYPKYLLKLFRLDKVQVDQDDLVDHHFRVPGRVSKLAYDLIEENRKEDDIAFWIDKHNRYARLLAQEELRRGAAGSRVGFRRALCGTPDERVAWLKGLWSRMPLYVRPCLYFVYRYFLRLGFLDGKEGFVFHFLQAWWFRLLVDVHLDRLRASASAPGTRPQHSDTRGFSTPADPGSS